MTAGSFVSLVMTDYDSKVDEFTELIDALHSRIRLPSNNHYVADRALLMSATQTRYDLLLAASFDLYGKEGISEAKARAIECASIAKAERKKRDAIRAWHKTAMEDDLLVQC